MDHTARPTWKLRETVHFYRDILGLPLVHVISARGWGPATHPDFLHFFFDSGRGSTIAFFYYLGSEEPEAMRGRSALRPLPEDHVSDATHTAWQVESEDELKAWKQKLQDAGLDVSVETRHEVIESIYVRDPNGYFIEFTRKLRPLAGIDATDAALTLQAAMQAEADAESQGQRVRQVDDIWRARPRCWSPAGRAGRSGRIRRAHLRAARRGILRADRGRLAPLRLRRAAGGRIRLHRRRRPAGVPSQDAGPEAGGLVWPVHGRVRGAIDVFDRDRVRISPVGR